MISLKLIAACLPLVAEAFYTPIQSSRSFEFGRPRTANARILSSNTWSTSYGGSNGNGRWGRNHHFGGNGGGYDSFGWWRGGGYEGSAEGDAISDEVFVVLERSSRRFADLPVSVQKAILNGAMTADLLRRYLELSEAGGVYAWLTSITGFRDRLLMDRSIVQKIGIEMTVGAVAQVIAEWNRRGERLWQELDFAFADILTCLVANYAAVYISAPAVGASAAYSGAAASRNIPCNAFQMVPPGGRPFAFSDRLISPFLKVPTLFTVGLVATLLGYGTTDVLGRVRRMIREKKEGPISPAAGKKKAAPQIPVFKTSAAIGVYLAISTNIRYQVLSGLVEERMIDQYLRNSRALTTLSSFVVRALNNYIGSAMMIDYLKMVVPPFERTEARDSESSYLQYRTKMKFAPICIVKGRVRDEFQCPITATILRDPVVAKDGHTYERAAITTWLETHKTSPMTKEEISSTDLVPNLNLKRLIYDLVGEGGAGLAARTANAEEAQQETAFGFDDVMVLRCLGPAESEWIGKTQLVTKEGISGGRRRNSSGGRESMVFQDSTVSRRHFESGWGVIDEDGTEGFYIQDLGSAGGTYIRLRHREAMGLRDGAMLLVGKHQFLVVAPSRVMELTATNGVEEVQPPQVGPDDSAAGAQDKASGRLLQTYLNKPRAPLIASDGRPMMMLKCFAPEGSPMQHTVFSIGTEGASIGRKQSNTVSLSQEKNGEVLGLDSAVSGEHCRIEYHGAEDGFVLLDGAGDKPSTNGTWARLSYMQMPSPRQVLERDDEVLIGGILRFTVTFETTLTEAPVQREGGEDVSDGSSTPRSPEHIKEDEEREAMDVA